MKIITVVDARMGRGKSSAAIRYMNENKERKRFLYITPYLKEVERICEICNFLQPNSDNLTKSSELKNFLAKGINIAATHSLFYLLDKESLNLIKLKKYTLIIDENINVISRINITSKDLEIIRKLTYSIEDAKLAWTDEEYTGKFDDYKATADTGSLAILDNALFNIMNPDVLRAFDEIFMLTYLFDGQYQKAYLDFFKFPYKIVGIEKDDDGYLFSDKPDSPPPIDYTKLINLFNKEKYNHIGNARFDLSQNWYVKRGRNNDDVRKLRSGLRSFFRSNKDGCENSRLWTCFKDQQYKLVGDNGRYGNNFLQISARATNDYIDRTDIAYMVNRFADPNIYKFFATKGIYINQDTFALSEMIQWIWRSAIRDEQPINLYIPSKRMRSLFLNWIKELHKED